MKLRLLSIVAVLSLAACATTPTVYQPATGPGVLGYVETPIEHDRWRVSFRGAGGTDIGRVGDLALRRAAELTLAKGYDWFRVVGRVGTEKAFEAVITGVPLGKMEELRGA